jgi:NOL1/NOP2/fmu family ribosome biogenesis protein
MYIEIIRKAEKEKIIEKLKEQHGIEKIPHLMVRSGREKIRIFSGNLLKEEIMTLLKTINVENMGLYFANLSDEKKIRLSLDGAHIFKNQITKNILQVNDEQLNEWFRGSDIEINAEDAKDIQDFVVLKYKEDIIGIGRISNSDNKDIKIIKNFLPKERRRKN